MLSYVEGSRCTLLYFTLYFSYLCLFFKNVLNVSIIIGLNIKNLAHSATTERLLFYHEIPNINMLIRQLLYIFLQNNFTVPSVTANMALIQLIFEASVSFQNIYSTINYHYNGHIKTTEHRNSRCTSLYLQNNEDSTSRPLAPVSKDIMLFFLTARCFI